MIEQAKFTYSHLGKPLEKQTKTIQKQGRKKTDPTAKQVEKLVALTNSDNHKEIFEELVKEKFDKIKELTDKINHADLIYYFPGNISRT